MDMMAKELGLDPLEVRLKSAVEEGDPLPSGQPYPSIGLKECLEAIATAHLKGRRVRSANEAWAAIGGWMGGCSPQAPSSA
jgi:CO/xanthine dehydrogenase Mo-binding subunit